MKYLKYFCCLLLLMLSTYGIAGSVTDTLPQNSLRLEIAGKSLFGAGFTFEHAWQKKSNHPRAFNSVDANVGYAGYKFIVTSVGINRNWYITSNKKWVVSCGIAAAALICPDPTPKSLREYYDSIHFYGGEYINPIEPWLLGNLGIRYTKNRFFVNACFVPCLFYDRAYNNGFTFGPWGGLSIGLILKKKS